MFSRNRKTENIKLSPIHYMIHEQRYTSVGGIVVDVVYLSLLPTVYGANFFENEKHVAWCVAYCKPAFCMKRPDMCLPMSAHVFSS